MGLINNRYDLLRRLGQGTSGSVFLAHDLLHESLPVALKVVPASRLAHNAMRDVRHEFFTLSGLDHPNLVQALDFGTIVTADAPHRSGDHFLTYEFIEGDDLLHATVDSPWSQVEELAYQILSTLGYLHRHGLIHFDIKPENILVVPGSIGGEDVRLAKVIDFGFSSTPIGTDARTVRGSLAYLAPELIGSGQGDQRADLYSLGITLYHILTRTLPQESSSTMESLKRRLSDPPKRPSAIRPDIPHALDELVVRLTEPDLQRRIRSADEAAALLESRLDRRQLLVQYYRTIRPSHFVGRRDELRLLTQNLAQAGNVIRAGITAPLATPVIVTGPHGIGKTRLLRELKREARALDVLFLEARCAGAEERAFAPILPILREFRFRLDLRGGPAPALHEATALVRLLSEGTAGPQDADPSSLRFRIIERIAQFLGENAARQPFALWIDDADLADEATRDLVAHLGRTASHFRFLVYITATSVDADPLKLLMSDEHSQTIALKELSPDEALAFVRYLAGGQTVKAEDVTRLTAQVGSSPLMLGHVLSTALRRQDDVHPATVQNALEGLTSSLDLNDLYRQRFEALGQDEKDCLRLMSCFHVPAETTLILKLLAYSQPRTRQALSRLSNEGLVASPEFGRIHVAHAQFRDFVYSGLGTMRVALHRHIADAMERMFSARVDEHAEELAFHFHRSGDLRKAYRHYRRAAEKERSVSSYRRSAEFLEHALSLAPNDAEQDSVREQLAEVYHALSDYAKAEAIYRHLLGTAATRERRFHLHRTLGAVQNLLGRIDDATQSLTEASLLAVTAAERDGIDLDLASVEISKGDYATARRRLEKLHTHIDQILDSQNQGDLYNRLGIVHFYENHLEEARKFFSASVEALGTQALPDKLISPLLNLGNVHSFQGDFSRAEECWKQALTLTKKACNIGLEARIYNNLGIAEFSREQFAQAADYYGRAIDIFTRLGNRPGQALCLTNIGEVHFALGAYEQALDVWRSNLSLYESLEDNLGIADVSLHVAHALVMLGDLQGGEQRIATASQLIQSAGLTSQHGTRDLIQSMLELARGSLGKAGTLARAAEKFFTSAQDWRNLCHSRLTSGRIALLAGERADAATAYQQALRIAREHGFQILCAESLLGLAVTSGSDRAQGLAHPLSYLKEAFDLLEEAPLVETTWRISLALGEAYRRRGLRVKAEQYLRVAADTVAHLESRFRSDALRTQFHSTNGRAEPSIALEQLMQSNPS